MSSIFNADASTTFGELCGRAHSLGLAVRGAFHPEPREFDLLLPTAIVGTIVLLGFTGSVQWEIYQRSAEASSGCRDPLDRWSRRLIGSLAREWGAVGIFPSGPPPPLPFQRLAARSEPVHQSPIGLLIHPKWGLWHAYRGALVLPEKIALPSFVPSLHPCSNCAAKPCSSACPVQAFRSGSFDVETCATYVLGAAGLDCRERGCRARRACPVGVEFSYVADQARFHMHAFLHSVRPEVI